MLLLLLAPGLAAAALTSHAKSSASTTSLTIALDSDVSTMDPAYITRLVPERAILGNVMQTLVTLTPRGKLVPSLATSWKLANPTTWDFTLRKGVKFQDGTPFNAQAVKTNFDRILDPATKSPTAGLFSPIKEVRAVSDYQLQIVTTGRYPNLPRLLLTYPGMIVSPAAIAKGPDYLSSHPVGTGPYEVTEWAKGDHITMVRNDSYWGPKPPIKTVTFKPVPEESTRVALLTSGQVDMITNLSPDTAKQLQGNKGDKVLAVPTGLVIVLELYVRPKDKKVSSMLFDPRVREALSLAIPRKSIIDGVLNGFAKPDGNPIPSFFEGYNPSIKPDPYDPVKAKKLLAQAGYPHGFTWTFTYQNSNRYTGTAGIVQVLQQAWSAIGVTTNLRPMSPTQFGQTRNERPPADLGGWAGRGAFSTQFSLAPVFADGGPSQLFTQSPKLARIIKRAEVETNTAKRTALWRQALTLIHNLHAVIVLHQQDDIYAFNSKISWKGRADEGIFINEMKIS